MEGAAANHDAKAYGDTMTDDAVSAFSKRRRCNWETGNLG